MYSRASATRLITWMLLWPGLRTAVPGYPLGMQPGSRRQVARPAGL